MLGNEQAAAVADSQQADYFRGFLSGLRADLESELAKQVRLDFGDRDGSCVRTRRRTLAA